MKKVNGWRTVGAVCLMLLIFSPGVGIRGLWAGPGFEGESPEIKVWAMVYDWDTLDKWGKIGFTPSLKEVDEVLEGEKVLDLHIVAPKADGQWYHLKMRMRSSDGAIAVVSMNPVIVPTEGLDASIASIAKTAEVAVIQDCDAGPWWQWGRICCFSQLLICRLIHKLLGLPSDVCDKCFWECYNCLVTKPCHSCDEHSGGSDVLCKWFGHCD